MSSSARSKWLISTWGVIVLMLVPWIGFAYASQTPGETGPVEPIKGSACYKYGDNETPVQAKRAAITLAQEDAVRLHRVFVQSSSKVKNLQLEEDIVQTASAGMLEQVRVEKEEKHGQEICITIAARMSPVSMDELIKQRINAKEISQQAQAPMVTASAGFGLRVWTDRPDGRFTEGDQVVIHVLSDRDGYLKLDYFQADGCVVHLVPNLYRGQAFIKGGQTYSFGSAGSPEQFTVTDPFGTETIKAIVGVKPFDPSLQGTSSECDDGRAYVQGLQNGLRGLKVAGVEQAVTLTTVSRAVEGYRKDRR
ncbi:MAG: DUF4384 domain-containing protein [Nitrospira defluvii]|nr:DUF4384 domain-containing protein [Nitrospira defluvii]